MEILLTGGSKGIGFSILKKLLKEEHKVTVVSRSDDLIKYKWPINILKCDLSNINEVEILCNKIKNQHFDVLINNAGGSIPIKLEELSVEQINEDINLNLIAPLMLIKTVIPNMKASNFGRIINISSISSKRGTPYLFTYSAAKAGLNSLTQSISRYLGENDITVNSICPGGVDTKMSVLGRKKISNIMGLACDDYQNNMIKEIGMNRLIKCEEIAELIMYLINKKTSYISGQSINVCGTLEVI
ncbi:SDR family oxidoreductase [Clostridium perfringens]|uniref:SDR family oxidoreductase n=1 Tax=Clostridium perfringens TaxID=1502 RepID=UPI00103D5C59|nr:SDR family oxidoreductase [Clostridium perfringens]TBX05621.1 hypothetical protein BFS03_13465 [Clostridium perfringens]